MSEPDDGGWSDGSADMDVDDIVDSTSVESDTEGKNLKRIFMFYFNFI